MIGWLSVFVIVVVLIAGAWSTIRMAVRAWWDYPAIFVIAAVLLVPIYAIFTGDVSRVLPSFLWSDDADGKDQVILASLAATLLVPLIFASLHWHAARKVWAHWLAKTIAAREDR